MNENVRDTYLPIEEYLPHRGRMVLLDRLLEAQSGRALATVTIRADSPFCREGQVPAYVGVEYMAQTIGALVGWQAKSVGEAVKTGFLVSVRNYVSQVESFVLGETLFIEAKENWRDEEGLGVMDCAIYHPEPGKPGTKEIAKATLMVFQPKDLDAYIATS
jgi:predicted hotdog family 3-hydroxylacyl-ACP dehydratase